ncbi:MAG: purine-binding chemotaxis protein CheW [Kiritimatiellia bacterium]|jgi:purine-binding chemotaxis protein CheW
MLSENQYCTFYLDDLYLGITVVQVQEVLRYQEMTVVPLSSDSVHGLINLRGQIVPAIDLRSCLGLPVRADHVQPMNVVIRLDDGAASLLVDEIGDVLEVDDSHFEAPPQNLHESARGLIEGVYKLEGALLLILDVAAALGLDAEAA